MHAVLLRLTVSNKGGGTKVLDKNKTENMYNFLFYDRIEHELLYRGINVENIAVTLWYAASALK